MDSSAVSARLIGAIFVEKGLVTDEQLEVALEQQRTTGDRLGEILVEQFGVERLDLASALAEQWAEYERQGSAEDRETQSERRDLVAVSDEWRGPGSPDQTMKTNSAAKRPIGEIFVERGLVTEDQLEEALEQQKKTGTRLGEILVASGKLSRLELASALADQWASFQKLRPPEQSQAPAGPPNGDVTPTPDVGAAPAGYVPAGQVESSELGSLVEALAARVDELAAGKVDWKPEIEKTEELLRSRLERLEELVAAETAAGADDLRAELARLAERIEAIPAPTDEWRIELGQVAENLRMRIERVEQISAAEQLAALREALDGLVERVNSLPVPSEAWRDATTDLAARIDSLAASTEGWRDAIAEVSTRIDSLPAPTEDWRAAISELSGRIESLPAPSDEWREAIGSIETRLAELGKTSGGTGKGLRAELDALAARLDALPEPSEDWRGEIASIRQQIAETPHSRENDVGEVLGLVQTLGARLDALPVDAWRPELAEVAENLRTRVERVEERSSGSEAVRAELEALVARVDTLPEPSEEWRDLIAGLAARIDGLPVDAWRTELAEVAENLRTRVERVEQRPSGSEEIVELRLALAGLAERLDSLPQPADEWRGEIAGIREQIELAREWRESDAAELRGVVDALAARVDALPVDAWRSELAEVAENLRIRVERIEQRPSGSEELEPLRAELAQLATRLDTLPQPSEEWREQIAGLAARVDAQIADTSQAQAAEALDTLRLRVERVEEGMSGQARAAAVTQIAEQVHELTRKVEETNPDAVEEKMQALTARIEALPANDEWREPLTQLAARVDSLPAPSEEWREQISALAARVETLRTDEWKFELAEVAENLRTRLERIEHEVGHAQAEQLDGLRSGFDRLAARVDAMPVLPLDEIRAELAELAQSVHGRIEQVEQQLPQEASADGLDALLARVDELSSKVDDAATLESRLTESLSALVYERAEHFDAGGAEVRRRLDDALRQIAAVATVAGRVDEVETRLDAETAAAAGLAPRLDELKEGVDRHTRRVEKLAGQVDELAARPDPSELEEALGTRLAATENALDEVRAATDGLSDSVDERITATEARAAAQAVQASADVESLRRELDDLRAVVGATGEATAGRIEEVGQTLHGELLSLTSQLVRSEAVDELRSVIERQDSQIETLGGKLVAFERGVEDGASARETEFAGLYDRLHAVESALAGSGGWQEALDGTQGRIDSLEMRLIESSSSEAVERNAEIEGLRSELAARVDAIESAQAKRKDVRELRADLERVEARVEERGGKDEATTRAVEEAVRDGLAGLGERLAATEETYLEAGRALRRSIEGLGKAISGADAHLAGVSVAPLLVQAQPTSYVAFAPTTEGYRLVTCDGAPPVLGSHVELPESEGVLVVTRVGASPLPFDGRPCVYLEPAQSSLLIARS